jgi:hypothetical protein
VGAGRTAVERAHVVMSRSATAPAMPERAQVTGPVGSAP